MTEQERIEQATAKRIRDLVGEVVEGGELAIRALAENKAASDVAQLNKIRSDGSKESTTS